MQVQAETSQREHGTKLLEFCLAVGVVFNHLSPPLSTMVPLIDRLQTLPKHVEHVVLEGAYHGSSMFLGQMVSYFNEIDAAVIVDGFAIGRNDEELDNIKEKVHPNALSIESWVDAKILRGAPKV